ncbi:MAG: hypothetical protein CFE21_08150 [Bacteroidetes bacterium B1(2017)]|nr:MAG: hypothetical protein CFE21_08150 [Bacteroidetes bacterium B1(2017)]
MKKITNILLIALVLQVSLSSCKKNLVDKYEETKPTNVTAKSVKEIKAPANFNWNTSNTVSFTFKGISGDARKSTLTITDDNNNILFRKLQPASENYTGNLELPAHVNKINVKYDGITTDLLVNSNTFDISLK